MTILLVKYIIAFEPKIASAQIRLAEAKELSAPRARFFIFGTQVMLKAAKITLVENLTKDLKDAKSVILVNYSGLNVKAQQDLKSKLKESGGR